MARPVKCRRVNFIPGINYYKPAGIPLKELEEVCLSIEELESLRLKDVEGLEQEAGAEKMNVSRPTFQRILSSARQKVADAILNGKAIRIEGGNYELVSIKKRCANGHEWQGNQQIGEQGDVDVCPVCDSTAVEQNAEYIKPCCNARHRGRRHGRAAQSGEITDTST